MDAVKSARSAWRDHPNYRRWASTLQECHRITNSTFPHLPLKDCSDVLRPITGFGLLWFTAPSSPYAAPETRQRIAAIFDPKRMKIMFPTAFDESAQAESFLFHEYLHWRSARSSSDFGLVKLGREIEADTYTRTKGHRLNEGATEYLNERIRLSRGITGVKISYPTEVALIKYLINQGIITEQDLIDAYFEKGYDHLAALIDKKLGKGACDDIDHYLSGETCMGRVKGWFNSTLTAKYGIKESRFRSIEMAKRYPDVPDRVLQDANSLEVSLSNEEFRSLLGIKD